MVNRIILIILLAKTHENWKGLFISFWTMCQTEVSSFSCTSENGCFSAPLVSPIPGNCRWVSLPRLRVSKWSVGCVGFSVKTMISPQWSHYLWVLNVSPHYLLQDPGERSDCGGGRDQFGGSHPELCCLRTQEHLRNCQVRVSLNSLFLFIFYSCFNALSGPEKQIIQRHCRVSER